MTRTTEADDVDPAMTRDLVVHEGGRVTLRHPRVGVCCICIRASLLAMLKKHHLA